MRQLLIDAASKIQTRHLEFDLDAKYIPAGLTQNDRIDKANAFLRSCTPRQGHQLLHDLDLDSAYYDGIEFFLQREDCDQVTAMNVVAHFYASGTFDAFGYAQGTDPQVARMLDFIRDRAWSEGFATMNFPPSVEYRLEMVDGMAAHLSGAEASYYVLPASFLPAWIRVARAAEILRDGKNALAGSVRSVAFTARKQLSDSTAETEGNPQSAPATPKGPPRKRAA